MDQQLGKFGSDFSMQSKSLSYHTAAEFVKVARRPDLSMLEGARRLISAAQSSCCCFALSQAHVSGARCMGSGRKQSLAIIKSEV